LHEPPSPPSKEELQKETEEKLHELLSQISSKPVYHNFVRNLFKLFDELKGYFEALKTQTSMKTTHLQKALYDAKEFVGEFTGKEELDDFILQFHDLYQLILEDQELTQLLFDVRKFLEECADKPQALTEEHKKIQMKQLAERAREMTGKEKWKDQFRNIGERAKVLLNNVSNDAASRNWTKKVEKFGSDFIFNEQGQPDIFVLEDSIHQLKNLLIPLVKHALQNIPIERIEVYTDTYDVKVEDIAIDATTFLPEHLEFKMLNVSSLDFKDEEKDFIRHQLLLRVDRIRPEFKNLKFYYKRKSFPKIQDFGAADLALTGDGLSIGIVWTVESSGKEYPVATLSEVKCIIDKLAIRIIGEATKHEWLDTILAPLISNMLKNKLSTVIEDYLSQRFLELNTQLNEFLRSSPTYQLKLKADKAMKQGFQQTQMSM